MAASLFCCMCSASQIFRDYGIVQDERAKQKEAEKLAAVEGMVQRVYIHPHCIQPHVKPHVLSSEG